MEESAVTNRLAALPLLFHRMHDQQKALQIINGE
jgi:hypothetical protein